MPCTRTAANARKMMALDPAVLCPLLLSGVAHAQACDPAGLLASSADYRVGNGPRGITMGDFNGDGVLDLATCNSAGGDVSVLMGLGDGAFGPLRRVSYGPGPWGIRAIASADFDGDGNADLAVADAVAGGVVVLAGLGDGSFGPARTWAAGTLPIRLATADLDSNGHADLIVADDLEGAVSVLLSRGAAGFDPATPYPTGMFASKILPADFDGDGILDLAVCNRGSEASLLVGLGNGTFEAAEDLGFSAVALATADFDGDGVLDLAAMRGAFADRLAIHRGLGDGSFGPATQIPFSWRTTDIEAADLDGDGAVDVVATSGAQDLVWMRRGLGDGGFERPFNFAVGEEPQQLIVIDADGNGSPDLATANEASGDASVLLNRCQPPCRPDLDGDGALTIFDFLTFGNLFDLTDPRADFDGDGDFTIFDFLAFQNAFDAGCG